jgi:hypothetical protein
MIVEIPVTIIFDHDAELSANVFDAYRAGRRVFGMRYDTLDLNAPAQWTPYWPPSPHAAWHIDTEGLLFSFLTARADRAIRERAENDPETYSATVE